MIYLRQTSRSNERGSTVAEFVVAASIFFMMIFGIIEFGRLLYTHNALTDAARRGARYAALHGNVQGAGQPNPVTCVKNVVVYGEKHIDPVTCAPNTGAGPLIYGLTTSHVNVTYVGADLDNDPATPPTAYGMNLGTATVTIDNYQFQLQIPFFRRTLTLPAYATTLTAESAGTEPAPI
jgi:Flp pilus assembly protein TadG